MTIKANYIDIKNKTIFPVSMVVENKKIYSITKIDEKLETVKSIAKGYDIFDVLKIACINPKEHCNLDLGLLRVGDKADFIEVEDLESFKIIRTFIDGEIVSENSKTKINSVKVDSINNFHARKTAPSDFVFESGCDEVEVIQAIDHELFTLEKIYHTYKDRTFGVDTVEDILKITVINRYENLGTTKPAIAFVKGFGLKKGAIASCVAHDSRNIIAVGCSDDEISRAVNLLIESKGGISAVDGEKTLHLPLDVAGIMSSGDAYEVAQKYDEIDKFSKEVLLSTLSAPFMTLSFMALLVIPEIKLSDKGLFDGKEFHFIPSCVKLDK